MEHVRWLAQPTLHRPVLVAAFTGWNDAADAASGSVQHLLEMWNAQPLAELDPEEFTDFATVRPQVRLTPEQRRTIIWPTVGMWSARTPGGDVILMLGPEPALRWRLFTEQVMGVAHRFGVSMMLTLGALLADVPHSRPVQVIGTATDDDTIERFDLQRSRYEGPTGIVGVLQDACVQQDLPSASLWAAIPAYASQLPSPKATLALVERACQMLGTPAPVGQLPIEADDYDQRVSNFVGDDSELIGYVARLENLADSGELDDYDDDDDLDLVDLDDDEIDGEYGGGPDERVDGNHTEAALPEHVDSEVLMAELERFLRDQGDGPS